MRHARALQALALVLLAACAADRSVGPRQGSVRSCGPSRDLGPTRCILPAFIVVDGVRHAPDAAAVRSLDPNRIESIDVLRGAAAVARFGAKAAPGVIVIHTRDAKRTR